MPEHLTASYSGRHAELYDLFYADKRYDEEAAFIDRSIRTFRPGSTRVLELACGTGTHALLLGRLGYQVLATDHSPDMLARARAKAAKANSRVEFRQQDMRHLDVPERPFDVILCLFDSIGYLVTNVDISKALHATYEHLAPDGILIFEFWHAAAMLRNYEPVRVRHLMTPVSEIMRISETEIDHRRQLCRVSYTIIEMRSDGTFRTVKETQHNRFFLVQEMQLFLEQAGLTPARWTAGFQDNEQIDSDAWHIVAVARRES